MKEPHGKIIFAGAEIASYWSGYMEGALETGEKAAQDVNITLKLREYVCMHTCLSVCMSVCACMLIGM